MAKEKRTAEERVTDPASLAMLKKAEKDGANTAFDRMDTQQIHCKFGVTGVCCKNCYMGPCKITASSPRGVCGADADTIAARNFLREVTSGTSAHSDHARQLVLKLKQVAEGHGGGFEIKDPKALHRAAADYKLETAGLSDKEIALKLSELFLHEFQSQEEPLKTLELAPVTRQNVWEKLKLKPLGIDRTVVESMHRTHIGVDHDYKNLLMQSFRTSLTDGWGGSRMGSIVSDILFGTPSPVRSSSNLGVLGAETVNIVVHGHEPALSEMLAIALNDPEIKEYAIKAGAKGITLAGLCCTANEVLMRHGIPVAGNFLQQELSIITGALEMLITDVQCCMPSLPEVAAGYHTEIVSTSDIAQTIGASHVPYDHDDAMTSAKNLLKRAVDNYKNRDPKKVFIPPHKQALIAGFSVDAIKYMLGGTYRPSFRPLNDAIISGRIKGVVGIVGCNNPKKKIDEYTIWLTKEFIKNDVLVLQTGCAAQACAKQGLLTPETALEIAGPGLREICETVGIPPVLHMGSCVDNSRILEAAAEIIREGGLGDDYSQVPAVGIAPEWMSEKAVAIGCYFVASGVNVILGHPFHVAGSENVTKFLKDETQKMFGGSFHDADSPQHAFDIAMGIINTAREKLGINKKQERKMLDMKDRRQMNV